MLAKLTSTGIAPVPHIGSMMTSDTWGLHNLWTTDIKHIHSTYQTFKGSFGASVWITLALPFLLWVQPSYEALNMRMPVKMPPWDGRWPEHAVGQCGAQCGGTKVGDVPSVKTLLRQGDTYNHLIVVDVQQDLGASKWANKETKTLHKH